MCLLQCPCLLHQPKIKRIKTRIIESTVEAYNKKCSLFQEKCCLVADFSLIGIVRKIYS